MHSGKEKKLTVMTKNINAKKPNLQIDTNTEQQPPKQLFPPQMPQQEAQSKAITILPSPINVKALQNTNDVAEGEVQQGKKVMQKKNSQKQQITFPKPQLQPKISANLAGTGFTSPKAAFNKDKILISYTSQKNLGLAAKNGPKDQRDSKAVKIQQLQKIIEESKLRESELSQKQQTLGSQLQRLQSQNAQLKAQNADLKKKIQKYKVTNEQTKKMLKQRIHSYNEEGGQLQQLRNQIKTLQERVQSLLTENLTLKAELNKFSDFNMKDMGVSQIGGSHALVVSSVREVPLQSSRVSQLYLRESAQADLLQFNDFDNMQQNLDLQSYISQAQQSYLEEYKTNVQIFDKIKQQYDQIMVDIEVRFKVLVEQLKLTIKSQASQICTLQNSIDELSSQRQQRKIGDLSLSLNEIILRNQKQIAQLNLSVYDLREGNKELTQNLEHHRAQCRFLQAQLDIQRMKKRFKNQNDKFQFNVVKLNLLNIIDKLKVQIDREKTRFTKLHQKYTAGMQKKQVKT